MTTHQVCNSKTSLRNDPLIQMLAVSITSTGSIGVVSGEIEEEMPSLQLKYNKNPANPYKTYRIS